MCEITESALGISTVLKSNDTASRSLHRLNVNKRGLCFCGLAGFYVSAEEVSMTYFGSFLSNKDMSVMFSCSN